MQNQHSIRTLHRVLPIVAGCLAIIPARSLFAYNTYTLTFQQGANGYTGELDRSFASNTSNSSTRGNAKGTAGAQLGTDGYNGSDSPDQQVFLQFNNIIGSGANLIPSNAFILDASLALTTGAQNLAGNSSANSGGYFGVGGVLVPWNTTTSTYNNLKPAGSPENGLDAAHGAITPAVGFFDDPTVLIGGDNKIDFDTRYTASVTPLVQSWTSGTLPNYGFTVHAGAPAVTTDAWGIRSSTFVATANDPAPNPIAVRPKLTVTYTNAPVHTVSFQQGVNGYSSTTMSWVRLIDDTATDGSTLDNKFLDGYQTADSEDSISSDDHALLKFNNIFQSDGGSIPAHAVIVKATLVLTTGTASNAQTRQPYQAHQMLRDWSTSTTWTDFDSDYGIRVGIDESEMLSAQYGMIPQSQAQFDITQAVANWAAGAPNYGIDVRATPPSPLDPAWTAQNGTSDGWDIFFTGASDPTLRPQLLVSYFLHLPGDANDDGKINADDFVLTDRGFNKQLASPQWSDGDFNYDGLVNSADYLILDAAYAQQSGGLSPSLLAEREAEFGSAYVSALIASVPEPASLSLLAAALPLAIRRRRRA